MLSDVKEGSFDFLSDNLNNNASGFFKNKLTNKLNIVHSNVRSLYPHKIDNVRLLANELDAQIICLSETWLSSDIPNSAVSIPHFNIHRYDANNNFGSVCIYTHNMFHTRVINIPDINCEPGIDFLILNVQASKYKSFIVSAVYLHPPISSHRLDVFIKILIYLCTLGKRMYILGDININFLDKQNQFSNKLKSFLLKNTLIQIIKEPTRITKSTRTLIDVCISNDKNIISGKSLSDNIIADHNTIIICLNLSIPKPSYRITKTFRRLKGYNINVFNNSLNSQPFENIYSATDINSAVATFNVLFNQSLDVNAPYITKTFRHNISIPFPKSIMNRRIEMNRLCKKAKQENSTTDDWYVYKQYKKILHKNIMSYRSNFLYENLMKLKNNPKKLWTMLNQVTPFKKNNTSLPEYIQTRETANNFNRYFGDIGQQIFHEVNSFLTNDSTKFPGTPTYSFPKFELNLTNTKEVSDIIKSLKHSSSMGVDEISTMFIKDSSSSLIRHITYLINMSLLTSTVPKLWKTAIIIPIYKNQGNELEPSNYRPIAILPILSKVLEKVVFLQLLSHLEKYRILNSKQFGFRTKSSTSNALNYVCNKLYTSLDKKKISLLILLDLSKAFDSISHTMLLKTLNTYNTNCEWFIDYLSDRSQTTKIGNVYSDFYTNNYGVPQGSILGPVFFTLFINEITTYVNDFNNKIVNVDIVCYADDTQLLFTSEFQNYDVLIKHATLVTNKIISWFSSLRLKINSNKSQCMLVCSNSQYNKIPISGKSIILNNNKLNFVDSVNDLGITLDKDMKFNNHINNIYKKVFSKLTYINKTRAFHTFLTRKLLVESLALSKLNYCRDVWGPFSRGHVNQIQKLYNFGAKLIFCRKKHDHASDLITKLNWLNVDQSSKYFVSCFVYKHVNNMLNSNISSAMNLELGLYTRSKHIKYILPSINTNYGEWSLNYRAPCIWNTIPENVKSINNLFAFKKALKKYLLSDN